MRCGLFHVWLWSIVFWFTGEISTRIMYSHLSVSSTSLKFASKVMNMSPKPLMQFDGEGVRRVARVLLNHVEPRDRREAVSLLCSRLGSYADEDHVLRYEVDRYFETRGDRAA